METHVTAVQLELLIYPDMDRPDASAGRGQQKIAFHFLKELSVRKGAEWKLNIMSKEYTHHVRPKQNLKEPEQGKENLRTSDLGSVVQEPYISLLSILLASYCVEARPKKEVINWG